MKRLALALAIAMAASAAGAATEYAVDENHDGQTDRMLELEQSDSPA